jgi:hypothetical protein
MHLGIVADPDQDNRKLVRLGESHVGAAST